MHGIEEVDRFLQNWMMHEDGTFYTSQEDDPPGLSENMNAIDYWLLDSDKKRRQFGVPPIDHAIYTDKNAQAIIAYAGAYEASGKSAYLDIAVRATKALMASRLQDDGWILQTTKSDKASKDKRMRPLVTEKKPFLSAQAAVNFSSTRAVCPVILPSRASMSFTATARNVCSGISA